MIKVIPVGLVGVNPTLITTDTNQLGNFTFIRFCYCSHWKKTWDIYTTLEKKKKKSKQITSSKKTHQTPRTVPSWQDTCLVWQTCS